MSNLAYSFLVSSENWTEIPLSNDTWKYRWPPHNISVVYAFVSELNAKYGESQGSQKYIYPWFFMVWRSPQNTSWNTMFLNLRSIIIFFRSMFRVLWLQKGMLFFVYLWLHFTCNCIWSPKSTQIWSCRNVRNSTPLNWTPSCVENRLKLLISILMIYGGWRCQ